MSANSYDIVRIKERLPSLSDLLTRDGHTLRRVGSAVFLCCPFHTEDTASCQVNERQNKYHCFGCGAGGDTLDYWQKSRDLSFQDALAQLASLAGVGPDTAYTPRTAATAPKPAPVEEKPVEPMRGAALAKWHTACDRLFNDQREIARIAEWRGICPDCVRFAAGTGLMGTYEYWGTPREAFLVEMPTPAGLMPVSVHVRLAPHTKGNDRGKASWHFDPKGSGAWPFIIGDLMTAEYIFLTEGQWDALALVSAMGWHRKEWPKVAVVGLRGATSGAKLLKHEMNTKADLFAIADADGAGARWFQNKGDLVEINGKPSVVQEDGILAKLHPRFRSVTAFWPTTDKCDLNDLVKSGALDRDTLLAHLQPLMADRRRKATGPTFMAWCKDNKNLPDAEGAAVRYILADKARPKGRKALPVWERHWKHTRVPTDLYGDLILVWNRYRAAC